MTWLASRWLTYMWIIGWTKDLEYSTGLCWISRICQLPQSTFLLLLWRRWVHLSLINDCHVIACNFECITSILQEFLSFFPNCFQGLLPLSQSNWARQNLIPKSGPISSLDGFRSTGLRSPPAPSAHSCRHGDEEGRNESEAGLWLLFYPVTFFTPAQLFGELRLLKFDCSIFPGCVGSLLGFVAHCAARNKKQNKYKSITFGREKAAEETESLQFTWPFKCKSLLW